jgi:hypothetical protein
MYSTVLITEDRNQSILGADGVFVQGFRDDVKCKCVLVVIVGSLRWEPTKKRSLFSRGKRCRRGKHCRSLNHQNQSLIKFIIIIITENRHLFD